MNDTHTSALSEAVDALRAKAQELSEQAENEMRRDLEEQAQVWHEAAELVRKLKRKPSGPGLLEGASGGEGIMTGTLPEGHPPVG